jgi:ribokinase
MSTQASRPVVVVGSINTDYVLRVSHRPQPGETVIDAHLSVHGGGKGANQALAAAIAGSDVHLVGRVGDDPQGETRITQLSALGVRSEYVSVTDGTPTGSAFVTVTPDGANSIIVAPGANGRITTDDVDRAAPVVKAAGVLVAQLEIPVHIVDYAIRSAAADTAVILNCAPFKPLGDTLLSRVSILVANEHEASQMLERDISGSLDALAAAASMRRLGPTAAVITLGASGAVVASDAGEQHLPAPPATVVDTTGAGDAFVGSLSARLAAGDSLERAVEFAVAMGSATTEQAGPHPHLPRALQSES